MLNRDTFFELASQMSSPLDKQLDKKPCVNSDCEPYVFCLYYCKRGVVKGSLVMATSLCLKGLWLFRSQLVINFSYNLYSSCNDRNNKLVKI